MLICWTSDFSYNKTEETAGRGGSARLTCSFDPQQSCKSNTCPEGGVTIKVSEGCVRSVNEAVIKREISHTGSNNQAT